MLLLVFRQLKWSYIRPYLFIYTLTPLFFMPRIWQAIFRGSVPEQDPGTITFSFNNFLTNTAAYFRAMKAPFDLGLPHSSLLITLGTVGILLALGYYVVRMAKHDRSPTQLRFGLMLAAWMATQFIVLFVYYWGQPMHPASGRLILAVDLFMSFGAAWLLSRLLGRLPKAIPFFAAVAFLIMSIPAAAEGRFINQLTMVRQASAQWKFFEGLHDQRILILTDRPGLFTPMNYGALEIHAAKQSKDLLNELERRLFQDIYVIQEVNIDTKQVRPDFDIWPDVPKETMMEFQNDPSTVIRIARIKR